MAKIRGVIAGEITGTVGDVTISTWKGMKVAKQKRGPTSVEPTARQKKQREMFSLATSYAREASADQKMKAMYLSLAKGQATTWWALAVQDFLTLPVISRIDVDDYHGREGDRIDLFVHDATCERVHLKVLDPAAGPPGSLGAVVEEGDASRSVEGQDFHWIYRAKAPFPGSHFTLAVEASDLPGNTSTMTVEGDIAK